MRNISKAHDRITAWADRDLDTGCLVSRYSVGSHGYAQAWDGETVVLAHRIVWERHHGPVAKGMTVDHLCHNRKCVEIEHLRELSNLENARRNKAGADWPAGQCINGHDDATYWRPKGPMRVKGYCHACRMDAQRRRRRGGV